MKHLKEAFKPMPERFHYSIESAINEAQGAKKQVGINRSVKIAAAVFLALVILPTSVFGSAKLYHYIVNREGNFGVAVEVEQTQKAAAPDYVKLNVADLDKYEPAENEGGLKYCYTGNQDSWAFTFDLARPAGDYFKSFANIEKYRRVDINGREAIIMNAAGLRRNPVASIYFEEADIVLTVFFNSELDDAEMLSILKAVSITDGTKNDCTVFSVESEKLELIEAEAQNSEFVLISQNKKEEILPKIDASVNNIRVTDNVKSLDRSNFYFHGDKVENYINADGSLQPRKSEIWKLGDGFNATDEFIKSETLNQKFILADVTYTNASDEEQKIYIGSMLFLLDADENNALALPKAETADLNENDGLAQYIKNADADSDDYYFCTLAPGETKTVTIGFKCDENKLDRAYIVLNSSQNLTPYYTVKVQ